MKHGSEHIKFSDPAFFNGKYSHGTNVRKSVDILNLCWYNEKCLCECFFKEETFWMRQK